VPIRAGEGQLATEKNAAELLIDAELRPNEGSIRAHREALPREGIERLGERE
jgi:hypothetical protein